ncbi:EamA family transporter RarD [Tumebacillus permanentifrigoris]|uniref:Chloramphenicol-sensitive protein RarD n=1 Tax=Tumebacillus permanentifrigoris TaxID=378543 RepID=A0A316D969_9BACL|nr:EamA family transporter RarD [Tumebacillus permanentifrigoris]PWK13167.1 chloramphenicol-sensitive protein RarD [Tumebacillus permanentifrigoris]
MKKGLWYSVAAYGMWGLLPLYWKVFQDIGAWEILSHRIIWSVVFVLLLVTVTKRWKALTQAVPDAKSKRSVIIASLLISLNWLIYIWAVNNNHMVEASLGYYINPLMNVFLGVFLLQERLSKLQGSAIALAALGVLILTISYGQFPWVSLSLATSFALYGFTKKKANLDTIVGLSLETLIVLPFALIYLVLFAQGGEAPQLLSGWRWLLLSVAGVATALPLLFFAEGVKRLPLSIMGFVQYLSPTITLFLGVLLYHESFSTIEFLSFGMIWSALVLYMIQVTRNSQRSMPSPKVK